MEEWSTCPAVCSVNAWVWLNGLGRKAGRMVSLGDVPQAELERLAGYQFDAIWLMGVWQRSLASQEVARTRGTAGRVPQGAAGFHDRGRCGFSLCRLRIPRGPETRRR